MTNNNWKDLHPKFTVALQQDWEDNEFTYEEVKEWIAIGLTPYDADFCEWLTKEGYTALAVLNYGDHQVLRKDYQASLNSPCSKPNFNFPHKPSWKVIIAAILTLLAYFLLTN